MRHATRFAVIACVAGLWFAPSPMTAQRSTASPPASQFPPLGPGGPTLDVRTLTRDLPFPMAKIAVPLIPDRTVRITDHGARGDGATLNTAAIAAAIDACSKAGGGQVVVPRGVFLTGPIELKSRIDLHLERGALLLFSPRFEEYPLVRTSYEGGDSVKARSPIWAKGAEDIAITGEGIIDGSGQAWRPVKQFKMTDPQWKALLASGGVVDAAGTTWWPSREAMTGAGTVKALDARGGDVPLAEYAAARQFLRPVMISLVECRRVLLDGSTFQNSPAWNIHPLLCEDLVIRNITVLNPWYSQNGDGLDLESCRRVAVYRCRFDVGDDAICIKSGKDEYGRRRGRPTEDVVIVDNVVYHGHGGFTVGSEMSGGVRNILVERCTFLGTDVGLRFKTTRGRGGVVEKIWIRDIQMKDIPTDAIGFNMYYGGEAPTEAAEGAVASRPAMPVNEGTPQFRDIVLSRILCRGADRAVMIEGLPEMPIRGIVLDDVRISARRGLAAVDAENIALRHVEIAASTGPAISVRDSRGVTLDGVPVPGGDVPARAARRGDQVVWTLDNLKTIGGHAVSLIGAPRVVATPAGPAIEFDGVHDGLLLEVNPIEGLAQFTVEALIEPASDGPAEQRFIHISETGTDRRVMMETRILPDHSWSLDTFLLDAPPGLTLLDRAKTHATDGWHVASLTYDGKTMTHYVDGVRDGEGAVPFGPMKTGRVSIGVRQNLVSWFKGKIAVIRISPEALPAERLLPTPKL
ncbi:MAG: glycosyl hydrolase family 28 protein [Acidobacteria bacterium]|nr:glycosyl hydrolase family 28 protein [Acidobacteriota bacterium]